MYQNSASWWSSLVLFLLASCFKCQLAVFDGLDGEGIKENQLFPSSVPQQAHLPFRVLKTVLLECIIKFWTYLVAKNVKFHWITSLTNSSDLTISTPAPIKTQSCGLLYVFSRVSPAKARCYAVACFVSVGSYKRERASCVKGRLLLCASILRF